MKKKLLTIFCILFGLALIIFFLWRPFCTYAADHVLRSYCETAFGKRLSFESLELKNGKILIKKPLLGQLKDIGVQSGYYLQAEEVLIDYELDWLNWVLDTHVQISKPNLSIVKKGKGLPNFILQAKNRFAGLNIKEKFAVNDGVVELIDISGECPVKQMIYFKIDGTECDIGKIRVDLGYQNNLEEDNTFKVFINKKVKDFVVSCSLNQLQCRDITKTMAFLGGKSRLILDRWNFLYGTVNGAFSLKFHSGKLPSMEGHLDYKDLRIAHTSLSLECFVPGIALSFQEGLGSKIDQSLPFGKTLITEMLLKNNGSLVIDKGASVTFHYDDSKWGATGLRGKIDFTSENPSSIFLEGQFVNQMEVSDLIVEGKGFFLDQPGFPIGDLNLIIKDETNKHTHVRAMVDQVTPHQQNLHMQFSYLREKECRVIQDFLGSYYPDWQQLTIERGQFSAQLRMVIEDLSIKNLAIENFVIHDAIITSKTHTFQAGFEEACGTLSLDFSSLNPVGTLNMDAMVSNGTIRLRDKLNSSLYFLDIQSQIAIRKGLIQQSLLQADFAGLRGIFEWNRLSTDAVCKLNVSGTLTNIISFLPESFNKYLEGDLSDNNVWVQVFAKQMDKVLTLKGSLQIDREVKEKEHIQFGFDLQYPNIFKSGKEEKVRFEEHVLAQTIIDNFAPFLSYGSTYLIGNWQENKHSTGKWSIQNGWFEANEFPIEKYLSPFEFQDMQLSLSGFLDFKATFDPDKIFIKYKGHDLILDSPLVRIGLETLEAKDPNTYPAFYYYDFNNKTYSGSVTLDQGSCLLKYADLTFLNMIGDIHITPDQIYSSSLFATWKDIEFLSHISLDCPNQGGLDLTIGSHKYKGTVSDAKRFFKHFSVSLFETMPFDGDVEILESGFNFRLLRGLHDRDVNMQIEGSLTNGNYNSESLDVRLQKSSFDFAYDYKNNSFKLMDLKGDVLFGPPNRIEKYEIATHYMQFSDFPSLACSFDVRLRDTTRDFACLAGEVMKDKANPDHLFVQLDGNYSHIGETGLVGGDFILKNGSELTKLNIEYESSLSTLKNTLKSLVLTGIFSSAGSDIQAMDLFSLGGNVKGKVQFDAETEVLTFFSAGEDVVIQDRHPGYLLISGWKQKDKWVIEQIKYDKINASLEFKRSDEVIDILFLRLRYGQGTLLDLKGSYNQISKCLAMAIKSFDIDFDKSKDPLFITQWLKLDSLLSGRLQFKGNMDLYLDPLRPWRMDTDLTCQFSKLKIGALEIEDEENVHCSFLMNKEGFILKNLALTLSNLENNPLNTPVTIDAISHDFWSKKWLVDNISFNLPVFALSSITDYASSHIPKQINNSFLEIIRKIKKEGEKGIQGNAKFELSHSFRSFELALSDDNYYFLDKSHPVKDFYFECDPFKWHLQFQYNYQNHPYWLQARRDAPTKYAGQLLLSDKDPIVLEAEGKTPLVIYWQYHEDEGISIQRAGGEIGGLEIQLTRQEDNFYSDKFALVGQVKIDALKLAERVPIEYQKTLKDFQIGKGYELSGKLFISKSNLKEMYFEGLFGGQDFVFLDYELKSLSSRIFFDKNKLEINNLKISDPSGEMQMDQFRITKNDPEKWGFSSPLFEIKNLRPSLLHKAGEEMPKAKTLLIDYLEVKDLHGNFADKESVKGYGKLQFHKTVRKQASLLDIPVHLISRLGLDLNMLIPTEGNITYEIKEGKMFLTKFIDVFSHEKRCRFYLAKSPHQSYIDFSGNLDIKVKMKQYVILKVTEPFIISVRGTLGKPTYHLQKRASHLTLN